MSNEILCLLLEGDSGADLYPLNMSRSIPALPIGGKYRLADIHISNCLHSGITRIFALTQFNSASLHAHIKNTFRFSDFSTAFVEILAAEQTPDNPSWYHGPADAVRQSLHHLESFEYDYLLIISGDQLYKADFKEMLAFHKKMNADITIAAVPVTEPETYEFGVMCIDDKGIVCSINDRPGDGTEQCHCNTGERMQAAERNFLAPMGAYIFTRSALQELLLEKYKDPVQFCPDILSMALCQYKTAAYQFNGYWTKFSSIRAFFQANVALSRDTPGFNLFDHERIIYTRERMLAPAKLNNAALRQTIVAEGCIVEASHLTNSIIGLRMRIGSGSNIENCYFMGNDFYETIEEINESGCSGIPLLGIGERCTIRNTIIDKNCRIGNDVLISAGPHLEDSDHEWYTIRQGIVIIKKGSTIPHGFKLG